jgi:hypothetical protein
MTFPSSRCRRGRASEFSTTTTTSTSSATITNENPIGKNAHYHHHHDNFFATSSTIITTTDDIWQQRTMAVLEPANYQQHHPHHADHHPHNADHHPHNADHHHHADRDTEVAALLSYWTSSSYHRTAGPTTASTYAWRLWDVASPSLQRTWFLSVLDQWRWCAKQQQQQQQQQKNHTNTRGSAVSVRPGLCGCDYCGWSKPRTTAMVLVVSLFHHHHHHHLHRYCS